MKHIMLDLETLGTGPDAAILSIGAVKFCPDTGELGPRFYMAIDPVYCQNAGLTIDANTVKWWMKQSEEARKQVFDSPMMLSEALSGFSMFCGITQQGGKNNIVWGNSCAFDNVILRNAYKAVGMEAPWDFWNDRCYRTLKALYPQAPFVRQGTHHNALDDAISQAEHAIEIFKLIGEKNT